jgi:hypothetical protein
MDIYGKPLSTLEQERLREREARSRTAEKGRGAEFFRFGMGCSLLGTGLALLIIAMVWSDQLSRAVSFFRGEMAGGSDARSTIRMTNNARQLLLALEAHAAENNGLYPQSLEELAPGTLTEAELRPLLNQGSPGRGAAPDAWIYFPGLSNSARSDQPVIASSQEFGEGGRILALRDGSVTEVTKEEYEQALARRR